MDLVFYYEFDITYILFLVLVIVLFAFFFLTLMVDRTLVRRVFDFLYTSPKADWVFLHQTTLQTFFLLVMVVGGVFVQLFYTIGPAQFCHIGSVFSFTLSGLGSFLVVNLVLVGYVIIFYLAVDRRLGARSGLFYFRMEELLFFFIFTVVTLFFFGCNDLLAFFICLEIGSFIFFVMTGLYGTLRPAHVALKYAASSRIVEASLKYLVPGLFSSLLFLLGTGILYLSLGTLQFHELGVLLEGAGLYTDVVSIQFLSINVGLFFLVVSFIFKLSGAPFHTWILWVYEGSLQHVVFFLATFSKFFYFLAFVKFIFPLVMGISFFKLTFLWVGVLSIGISTLFGLFELRFNSLIAYSGILNMGYCFLALALGSVQGALIALFMFFIYVVFSLVLFGLVVRYQAVRSSGFLLTIEDFKSLGVLNPIGALVMVVVIFGIIGIPPLLGFYPKFFLFLHLFTFMGWEIATLLLLCVIVSSFFYLRWISNLVVGLTLVRHGGWLYQTNYMFSSRVVWVVVGVIVLGALPIVGDVVVTFLSILLG